MLEFYKQPFHSKAHRKIGIVTFFSHLHDQWYWLPWHILQWRNERLESGSDPNFPSFQPVRLEEWIHFCLHMDKIDWNDYSVFCRYRFLLEDLWLCDKAPMQCFCSCPIQYLDSLLVKACSPHKIPRMDMILQTRQQVVTYKIIL